MNDGNNEIDLKLINKNTDKRSIDEFQLKIEQIKSGCNSIKGK